MSRNIVILLFLLLIAPSVPCLAQSHADVVQGQVTSSDDGQPVVYATCKLLTAADSLVAYAMTDSKGCFKIGHAKGAVTLQVQSVGYKTYSVRLKDAHSPISVRLHPEARMLNTVTVRVKPIEVTKDTINYNVAAFKGREDRYIIDVLKKLPGVEVSSNGAVTYKGNAINSFNIEGQDLLGNRYNQATRSIPADAVAQVQVMENDQPIKVLKDKVPSERATFNIKLKKGYRMRPFGEVSAGAGMGDDALWQASAGIINVGRKAQALVSAKGNNAGSSLAGALEQPALPGDDSAPPSSMTGLPGVFSVPVAQQRYLMNKEVALGINHIVKLSANASLRTNISYYDTSTNSRRSSYTRYGGNTVTDITENNRLGISEHTVKPEVRYELNSPKAFLTDVLSAGWSSLSGSNMVEANLGAVQERKAQHPLYVQNKMDGTLGHGSNTYTVSSLVRFYTGSERVFVSDTSQTYIPAELFKQRYGHRQWYTSNMVGTSFLLFSNNLFVSAGGNYSYDRVTLGGNAYAGSSMSGRVKASYVVRFANGHVSVDLPLNIFSSRLPWRAGGNAATKTYLSPYVRMSYDLTPMLTMRLSAYAGSDASSEVLAAGTMRTGYRTLVSLADRLGWSTQTGATLTLSYANMISMTTWRMMLTMSNVKTDHTTSYSYGDSQTTIGTLWRDSRMRRYFALMALDKTFAAGRLQVKGNGSYSRTDMPVMQNGLDSRVGQNVASASLTVNWKIAAWASLTNSFTGNVAWQDHAAGGSNTLQSYYNQLQAHVYPFGQLHLSVLLEQNWLENSRGTFRRNCFLDFSAQYPLSGRIDLAVQCNNLFNRQSYENTQYTGLNLLWWSVPLRGREVMATLTFRF